MGTRGGARLGAGRKKKPLAQKLLEGNPGRRPVKVIEFDGVPDLQGRNMPKPREYLSAKTKGFTDFAARQVYVSMYNWLKERKCEHLVDYETLERFSVNTARRMHCTEAINEYGYLSKHPTTGMAQPSPFVSMEQEYSKMCSNQWQQIMMLVKENCALPYSGDADEMTLILEGRWKG